MFSRDVHTKSEASTPTGQFGDVFKKLSSTQLYPIYIPSGTIETTSTFRFHGSGDLMRRCVLFLFMLNFHFKQPIMWGF